MRVGAIFPQTEIGNDPAAIRDYAQAAEEMGYTHILAYDHVLGAGTAHRPDWGARYTSETPFHEVFVLFGYLAAVTRQTTQRPRGMAFRWCTARSLCCLAIWLLSPAK